MDKTLRFLSDKLLAFEDSGEILKTEISYRQRRDKYGCDEQIMIVIKYNPDIPVIDKVRANDKILSFLCSKYGQVFQEKETIIVCENEHFTDEQFNYEVIKKIFEEFYYHLKINIHTMSERRSAIIRLFEEKFDHYILNLEEYVDLCAYFKKELNVKF